MVDKSTQNDYVDYDLNDERNQFKKQNDHSSKCQTTDDEEKSNQSNSANFIEFNDVKVYCKFSDDQLDSNLEPINETELISQLFDENDNLIVDQLINHDLILETLTRADDSNRFKLAERLLNQLQRDCPHKHLCSNLIPIIIQLIHPTKDNYNYQNEIFLETRKYAIDTLDELLKHNERTDEQKVNDYLNQLRYYSADLNKLKLNKPQNDVKSSSDEFSTIDLTIIDHPIDAISNLMKISFDEHYRKLIYKLGGIEAISELLIIEHNYHGFLLVNYEQIKQTKLKCDNQNSIKIDEKWINSNCITLRRYTAMALTNLTFGDKQSKLKLCLDVNFIDSLLNQLNYVFCEELIQVTSSVLRNLSWRASKICKQMLSELNAASKLMYCSMQVKKEITLKCILYALWNLSQHNMINRQKICEVDNAIKFLISLLDYQSTNNTLTIVENSSGILKNISSFLIRFDKLRKILRINNCHQILLKHLRSTSLTIVCNSVNIIWNISKDNIFDQRILINLGAITMLKNLTLSKHKIIQIASKETLKNLLTSECLKSSDFDLETISFRAFSVDSLSNKKRSNLLTQRKKMLLKNELKKSLKETESLDDHKMNHFIEPIDQVNRIDQDVISNRNCVQNEQSSLTNSTKLKSDENKSSKRNTIELDVLDISQSVNDYFSDLYKNDYSSLMPNLNETTIDHILKGLQSFEENEKVTNLDKILADEFYLNGNSKMINSISFFPGFMQDAEESKRSSMYSTISEPIMYYDNDDQFFTFEKDCNLNEDILEEEYRKLTKLSITNDFSLYDSNSIFHAYPVIITNDESNESKDNDDLFDDDLYDEMNENLKNKNDKSTNEDNQINKTSFRNERKSSANSSHNISFQTRIPVPVSHQTIKCTQNQQKNNQKQPKNQSKLDQSKSDQSKLNQLKLDQSKLNQNKEITSKIRSNLRTPISSARSKNVRKKELKNNLPSTTIDQQHQPKLPKIKKSKTMEKNIHNLSTKLPRSHTTDDLYNRTYELMDNDDLDEINDTENDAFANDLTYNVEEKRHNLTYILPSSESDGTLKNEKHQQNQTTDTDERTLVPNNDDNEKTDKNVDELNTYVQNMAFENIDKNELNFALNDDDDDATLHIDEINLSIDAEPIENLNSIGDNANADLVATELTDSIFVENYIENVKPPKTYHEINYSVASSLNNSFFASDESSRNSVSNSKSRLRTPRAKIYDLSGSPPTNTFTIIKSTKSSVKLKDKSKNQSKDQSKEQSKDQSKDQALSTSGYQTSLNSSILSNNSVRAIEKIDPPSILNQISGISSLNNSTTDCMSTCGSISSINSEIYDFSNESLNSSMNSSKKSTNHVKTSTPKHSANRYSSSKIVKPISRLAMPRNNQPTKFSQQNQFNQSKLDQNGQNQSPSKTDTFRKNKTIKKSNTSSISSTSSVSSKSDHSSAMKSKIIPLKASNQENLRTKKVIPTSKSMSRIGSATSDYQQTNQIKAKAQSKISSLWKRTVSNQQHISSSKVQVFKKKSPTTNSIDKKDKTKQSNLQTTNSLTRSSTFEKLPTNNYEAMKLSSSTTNSNAKNNKIRPFELQTEKRSVYN